MAIREGRWDCQYCGTTGIPGREKVCHNCARSRPEGTKFYLPEDEAEIEDEKLSRQAKTGADWVCEYCSSSNPHDVSVCRHCGAPREGSSPQQAVKEYGLDAVPRSGDMADEEPARPDPVTTQKKKRPAWIPIVALLGILFLFACACGAFLIFRTSEKTVTVDEMSWDRSVEVEAFGTVTEEDWDVPSGGRILSQREEIREYRQEIAGYVTQQRQVSEQVQTGSRNYVCGQRDLGNGFFEDVECTEPIYKTRYRTETYQEPVYEDVPIYDTLFSYEIDKWTTARTEQTAGNDQNVHWPALVLAANEREGTRSEEYVIVFIDEEGERYTLEFPLEEWLTFESRGNYELKVNGLGEPVEIVR